MRESVRRVARQSRCGAGTNIPARVAVAQLSCKFGAVACALWPVKPGLNLAQRAGCTERHANLLIAGDRKPNARAVLAVLAEIIP